MHKMLRTTILITFGMLIICIIGGCGDDDPPQKAVEPLQLEDDAPPPSTITVMVDPLPGSEVYRNDTEFTLTFSEQVLAVTVNDQTATGTGLTWKVVPHLPLGEGKTLNIKWTDQNGLTDTIEVGPYRVWVFEPPAIMSGPVFDGAVDVDPAPINAGGFRYDFDEAVIGTIKLTDEAGVDLNWIGTVAGQTATLTPVAGRELVNGTTYTVEVDVQDGAGNPLQVTITFVTKPK